MTDPLRIAKNEHTELFILPQMANRQNNQRGQGRDKSM